MLSFYIEASRWMMVLITEMGNMWKMNQFGREKNKEFCICSVEFQMPKKRLSKDTSHWLLLRRGIRAVGTNLEFICFKRI